MYYACSVELIVTAGFEIGEDFAGGGDVGDASSLVRILRLFGFTYMSAELPIRAPPLTGDSHYGAKVHACVGVSSS